ncbi:MAG: hypothetical protein J4O03_16830 [Chloroflexi bacterium]|nr:hypothetical protein [Chloroflexota bacterium]MCI0795130.1 hypothetical protein [Chloroflexota bacterium]
MPTSDIESPYQEGVNVIGMDPDATWTIVDIESIFIETGAEHRHFPLTEGAQR